MIDELEPKTRVVCTSGDGFFGATVVFTAEEDLMLRQVHMTGGVLSTEPDLAGPQVATFQTVFYLNSVINFNWVSLAFPLPKGSKLYWGNYSIAQFEAIALVLS